MTLISGGWFIKTMKNVHIILVVPLEQFVLRTCVKKVLSKNMDECSVQHGRIPKMSNSVSIYLQRIHLNYNESIEMCFGIIEVHIYTKICLIKCKNHLIEPVRLLIFYFKRACFSLFKKFWLFVCLFV